MLIDRFDREGYTEIVMYANGVREPWSAYRITCMDVDINREDGLRVLPTAHIGLLAATSATVDTVRLLVKEYAEVADVAEQLQNEKRAAYAAMTNDDPPHA